MIRIFSIFALAILLPTAYSQVQKKPLSLEDVRSLISELPDLTLAEEVGDRGVSPLFSRSELRRLSDDGVGPATRAALERFVRLSTLTVILDPPTAGIAVTVGGRTKTSDAGGEAKFDLDADAYTIYIEPPMMYRTAQQRVSV